MMLLAIICFQKDILNPHYVKQLIQNFLLNALCCTQFSPWFSPFRYYNNNLSFKKEKNSTLPEGKSSLYNLLGIVIVFIILI